MSQYGRGKCWRCGKFGHLIYKGYEALCEKCRGVNVK